MPASPASLDRETAPALRIRRCPLQTMLEQDVFEPRRRHPLPNGVVREQTVHAVLAAGQPPTERHLCLGSPSATLNSPLRWMRLVRLRLRRRPLTQVGATNAASPRNTCGTESSARLLLAGGSCGTQGCQRGCVVVVPASPAGSNGRSRILCPNGSRIHPARGCAPLGHVSATAWSSQALCRQKGLNQDDYNRRRRRWLDC